MPAKKATKKSAKKRARKSTPKALAFQNKLLLNQWMLTLFGIDSLDPQFTKTKRPFHKLCAPIQDPRHEGLDKDNIHHFYHQLVKSELFWNDFHQITAEEILSYEENIVAHTQAINEQRVQPITWKYYQWLNLLFVEIYLDWYFSKPEQLLWELNTYVAKYNAHFTQYPDVPAYTPDDLKRICVQNATGSGKTLLMHVNILQFRHYAEKNGKSDDITNTILITPNERLSGQHVEDFAQSNFPLVERLQPGKEGGLSKIDVVEITKLRDVDGPSTIAVRNLGRNNLVLIDEGHRGTSSGDEESKEYSRRQQLAESGFTLEYSATFKQAVSGTNFEDIYAKGILFDYSYRWFYEDGFGKDYKITNLPKPKEEVIERLRADGKTEKADALAQKQLAGESSLPYYLTAALLKFYQQYKLYEENKVAFAPFNIEKPLWVFVGSSVVKESKDKKKGTTRTVFDKTIQSVSDVAHIVTFFAEFLKNPTAAKSQIEAILRTNGSDTALIDNNGNDLFAGAFNALAAETIDPARVYQGILEKVFQNSSGGRLHLERLKGERGEVLLRCGHATEGFGLINVGDAKGLCDHLADTLGDELITISDVDFHDGLFDTLKESSSPINLLLGSRKFIEGWDCWRVSALGLMHVGKSEGSQIIQLFGRGVRLKGHNRSLKRSSHMLGVVRPQYIEELETLNVFGVESTYMETFQKSLEDEGLPGNEQKATIIVPLNVTHTFDKELKVIRTKKTKDGRDFDFKKDAPIPTVGELPEYLFSHKVESNWYPRIGAMQSKELKETTQGSFNEGKLEAYHLMLLDWDALYFETERFKRQRSWYNVNVTKAGLRKLLENKDWYTLLIPGTRLKPQSMDDLRILQQVAVELIKRYLDRYYNYQKRAHTEPRLELRKLDPTDANFPLDKDGNIINEYHISVDDHADNTQLIQGIRALAQDIEDQKADLLNAHDLHACLFGTHLFTPLFHNKNGKIKIAPVSLNESEYQFVEDLLKWSDSNQKKLEDENTEIFLLRNMSRGKGVGFFEASNFHPDFILWILKDGKQYVTFAEPHGLMHGSGPGDEKVLFSKTIKEIEKRLGDTEIILNSFILSWTPHAELKFGKTVSELEDMHILDMASDRGGYIQKLFDRSLQQTPEPV